MPIHVQLVCQFGEPVRGLSPYGDALGKALDGIDQVEIVRVDYHHAYPSFLHPAGADGLHVRGGLSWFSPISWRRVAIYPADIVHIQHWASPLACYLWPLVSMAKRAGKRIVITVHNPSPHEGRGFFGPMEDRLLRLADVLLVHGGSGCEFLRRRLGPSAPRLREIAHGMTVVDEPVVAQPEDYVRLGLDPTFRYVLLFGNLRGYKGVGELLAAWLRMSSRALDTRLVIAGRLWGGGRHLLGRMGARLAGTTADATAVQKLLTDARGNSSVVVREGFLRDAEIDALIRISSLAVFPYLRFGGQSGAACRAAACGRPVMVTRVGALGDLAIDDSWVVERGDVAGLAQRLAEKLVARDSLRAACHRQLAIARRCNWSAVAHDHLRVYQELM